MARQFVADASSGSATTARPPYLGHYEQGTGVGLYPTIVDGPDAVGKVFAETLPAPNGSSNSRILVWPEYKTPNGSNKWRGYAIYIPTHWDLSSGQLNKDGTRFCNLYSITINGNGPGGGIACKRVSDLPRFVSARASSGGSWPDSLGEDHKDLGPMTKGIWIYFRFRIRWQKTDSTTSNPNAEYWRKDGPTGTWTLMATRTAATTNLDGPYEERVGIYEGSAVNHNRTFYWDNHVIADTADEADPTHGPVAPVAARVLSSTLADEFDGTALDTTKWPESSGSISVGTGIATLTPKSEIKTGPIYDTLGTRHVIGPLTGGVPQSEFTATKWRVTIISTEDNGTRVSGRLRQTGLNGVPWFELAPVVDGVAAPVTSPVTAPSGVTPDRLGLTVSADGQTVKLEMSADGSTWYQAGVIDAGTLGLDVRYCKIALASGEGSGVCSNGTVGAFVTQNPNASTTAPPRRTKARTFVAGDRIQFGRGGMNGIEPKTLIGLVKPIDQTDRTAVAIASTATGGIGRALAYRTGKVVYLDGTNGGNGVTVANTVTDYDLYVSTKRADNTILAGHYAFSTKVWTFAVLPAVAAQAESVGNFFFGSTSQASTAAANLFTGEIAVGGQVNITLTEAQMRTLITTDGAGTLLSLWDAAGITTANGAEIWDLTEDLPTRRAGAGELVSTTGTTLNTTASVPWGLVPAATPVTAAVKGITGPGSVPANPVFNFSLEGEPLTIRQARIVKILAGGEEETGDWQPLASGATSHAPATNLLGGDYAWEIEVKNADTASPVLYRRTWTVVGLAGPPPPTQIGAGDKSITMALPTIAGVDPTWVFRLYADGNLYKTGIPVTTTELTVSEPWVLNGTPIAFRLDYGPVNGPYSERSVAQLMTAVLPSDPIPVFPAVQPVDWALSTERVSPWIISLFPRTGGTMNEAVYVGDRIRVRGVVTDESGNPADPSGVTVKVKSPAGAVTTYVYGINPELVRPQPGVYQIPVEVTEVGVYMFRFESSGNLKGAEESRIRVEQGSF